MPICVLIGAILGAESSDIDNILSRREVLTVGWQAARLMRLSCGMKGHRKGLNTYGGRAW